MPAWIDGPVLARQLALICVPLLLAYFRVPQELADALSGPVVEVLSMGLVFGGSWLIGWIVYIGQRRELPKAKIEDAAALPEVSQITVKSEALADSIVSKKVET